MKKLAFLCTAVTLTVALAWSQSGGPSGTQSKAEFAGSFVKWILAAEPEFKRRGIDLDHYIVSMLDEKDSVTISLRSFDSTETSRGSSGSFPGFEVEISKKNSKVMRSNYVR
jgi:hypothetical protein